MPIDVATGAVSLTREDVWIPGSLPLTWERYYGTTLAGTPSAPLGPGWTTRYFSSLSREGEGYQFRTPEGDLHVFADPEGRVQRGEIVRSLGTFQETPTPPGSLRRHPVGRRHRRNRELRLRTGRQRQDRTLAAIENVCGQGLDLVRDAAGRLIRIDQRLENRSLLLDYSPAGRIVAVRLLSADKQTRELVRYEYDGAGSHSRYRPLGLRQPLRIRSRVMVESRAGQRRRGVLLQV